MNPALTALAVGVVAGGVVAVSARDARISIVGLTVALVFAPLVAEPFPDALAFAARVVAAILAVYLLWIVARDGFDVRQSRLRWPVEALLAAGAGLAGLSSAALTTPPINDAASVGVPEARAAAFAIGALSIIPILEGRDASRLGNGLMLAVLAAALLQQGMGSSVAPLGHLAFSALMVAVAATSAGLGSLALAGADRVDRPVRAGAHPLGHLAVEAASGQPPGRAPGIASMGRRLDADARRRLANVRAGRDIRGRLADVRLGGDVRRRLDVDVRRRLATIRVPRPIDDATPEVLPVETSVSVPTASPPGPEPAPAVAPPPAPGPASDLAPEPSLPAVAPPAARAEPEVGPAKPGPIAARSAGARRSLPRNE
jgi:hypothetical protein